MLSVWNYLILRIRKGLLYTQVASVWNKYTPQRVLNIEVIKNYDQAEYWDEKYVFDAGSA